MSNLTFERHKRC